MEIKINGKKESITKETTIASILEAKKVRPEMVAVEVNGELIERESYKNHKLKDSDELEFLYYMAGG